MIAEFPLKQPKIPSTEKGKKRVFLGQIFKKSTSTARTVLSMNGSTEKLSN
jgi:hypothetical protein